MDKKQALVMWIIWFAFLQSAFIYHFFVGDGFPEGDNVAEPMALWLWALCIVPVVLATVVRWVLVPKLTQQSHMLVAMVVGLGLTEVSIGLELFLIGADYPQSQIVVLMLAVLSLIQFAPIYATPGVRAER
jgi:hypothetical protein